MCKEKLSKLKNKKKKLEEKIKLDQYKELEIILNSEGKTVEDVKDILKEQHK